MSNDKIRMTNEIQNLNIKNKVLSFNIWIYFEF